MGEVVLFDLTCRPPIRCLSPNVWKVRSALNFKDIKYTTRWLEYPDVEPTLRSIGVKPHTPEEYFIPYTCPTIQLPNGKSIMESLKIAHELEELFPEPSLRLNGPHNEAQTAATQIIYKLCPLFMWRGPEVIMTPYSAQFYMQQRVKDFGMTPQELAKSELATNAWQNAAPGMEDAAKLLKQNPNGPFVEGDQPGFADLVFASLWKALRGHPGIFEKLVELQPVIGTHFDACSVWFEKED